MLSYWYLKTITQTRTASGEQFILVTDVPCHLWLRYTFIEPKIHTIPVERRGLPLREDLYFCFDSYSDIEQTEPGDTLIHTFLVEPWPYCQERWYYFHGEIGGIPSPSTTPVFYKHPKVPPVTTIRCYPISLSPYAYSYNNNYAIAWAGPAAGWGESGAPHPHRMRYNLIYTIWRNALRFDTTLVPPGHSIVACKLTLRIDRANLTPFTVRGTPTADSFCIVNAAGCPYPGSASVFTFLLGCNTVVASWPFGPDDVPPAWYSADLPAAGLANVNAGGITTFGCRNATDIAHVDYLRTQYYPNCWSPITGVYRPYLDIDYAT